MGPSARPCLATAAAASTATASPTRTSRSRIEERVIYWRPEDWPGRRLVARPTASDENVAAAVNSDDVIGDQYAARW